MQISVVSGKKGGVSGAQRLFDTWQDVLHMLRLLALLFTLHALRCAQEQAEGQQGHASANPRNHVRPVILDGRGFLQDLIRGRTD